MKHPNPHHSQRRQPRPMVRAATARAERDPGSAAQRSTSRSTRDPAGTEATGDGAGAVTIYLRELGPIPMLEREEEAELIRRTAAGDLAARERLILAYLRLVVKIARSFTGLGVPFLDLISEGNIGLMKAVDRFKSDRGGSLSIYAAFWIRQRIRLALANQSRTIRLPVNVHARVLKLRRVAASLHGALGREPSEEELGGVMGLPAGRVRRLRNDSLPAVPLEAYGEDEGESTGCGMPADTNAPAASDLLLQSERSQWIGRCFSELDPRTQRILRCRYRLDGMEKRTLHQLGAELRLTRERIRQVHNAGLAKLRRKVEKQADLRSSGWA